MTLHTSGTNYQALALEYSPGDRVIPYGVNRDLAGRVTAVWPAIGMVDVEFSAGVKRYPVEDLQRLDHEGEPSPPHDQYVPGGAGTVSVPGGPYTATPSERRFAQVNPSQVADRFLKKALYWAAADRKYKATREELDSGCFTCPQCKQGQLRKAVYRREKGRSERLYGCPSCLWLVERDSILGHPENEAEIITGKKKKV